MGTIHNPDQYMADLRQVIAQSRKRIGFLIGSGAPADIKTSDGRSLIPIVAGLTKAVLDTLNADYGAVLTAVSKEVAHPNIEQILSRVRMLSSIIGSAQVYGLNGDGHKKLGQRICEEIGKIVACPLPPGPNPFSEFVSWISGADRDHAVEIFTTNYDVLLEEAFERARMPFFDGFVGATEAFFDPSTVSTNDLPPRWTRLWKLHGSIGWESNKNEEFIRTGRKTATHLVFPEYQKYDQTQKAPYSAFFDRLRAFLTTADTLLIASGFSFADAHVSARIDECLAANPACSVLAFQFGKLEEEKYASDIAKRRSNFSVYARDQAIINGVAAPWSPGDLPTRDWGPIRASYWLIPEGEKDNQFALGRFSTLARFFAWSRTPIVAEMTKAPTSPPAAIAP